MFRVFLVLATASVFMVLSLRPGSPTAADHVETRLVSSTSVLDQPTITVISAPASLALNTAGTVEVQATAPAAPGDRIMLDSPGAANLGYYKVSETVLDGDLRATLTISPRPYLGTYSYWAAMPATGTYQAGRSSSFSVDVVPTPPPPAPTCGGAAPLKADGTPWQCTYDDEFDGTSLDRSFWVPQVTATSGVTTGTKTRFACAEDSPDTIAVTGGNLELSLINRPTTRYCGKYKYSKYAYGQVMHYQTFSQTYGKYEIRAKIPDLGVPGAQESFWLWPVTNTYGQWPASGEIDFAELYSAAQDVDLPYLHYLPGATAAGTNENVTHAACAINPGEFNTYGVEWRPKQITVLLNGNVCFTDDYSSAAATIQGATSPFDKPFFLSLNEAMGTTGNLYDPAVMPDKVTTQIDYVRIWK